MDGPTFWEKPPPHTVKPVDTDVDFIAKTWAALADQVTLARSARRSVGHSPCDDRTPCRHCRVIRDAHLSIDDLLDQLELDAREGEFQ